MRIAFLGTRGVPARYSGFETCAEELGRRLAERGHQVTVYCRLHRTGPAGAVYRGMRRVELPALRHKYLDTPLHTLLSSLHALPRRYDLALYFIAGNSPLVWIPRLVGTRTVLNVDGLDWRREKWPPLARVYLRLAELLATRLPNRCLTDSRAVQAYYRDRFAADICFIPYGSEIERCPPGRTLARLGLHRDGYVLFVGRLVPENCAHHLIEAYRGLDTDARCVVVGDAPYAEGYKARLRQLAARDRRVVAPGYQFDSAYRELASNARIFVETSGVGGTHPALLEAMALGNCVVAHDTPENRETLGDAGFSYDGRAGAVALRDVLRKLLADPALVEEYRERARRRAREHYSWEVVADSYERMCFELCGRELPARLAAEG